LPPSRGGKLGEEKPSPLPYPVPPRRMFWMHQPMKLDYAVLPHAINVTIL
jgi:hypothetical protein